MVFCESEFPYLTDLSSASHSVAIELQTLSPAVTSSDKLPAVNSSPALPAVPPEVSSPIVTSSATRPLDLSTSVQESLPALPCVLDTPSSSVATVPATAPDLAVIPESIVDIEPPAPVTHTSSSLEPQNTNLLAVPEPVKVLGQGLRPKSLPSHLKDYILTTVPSKTTPDPSSTSSALYDIADYVDCSQLSINHCIFLAAITDCREPKSYKEASQDENWRLALRDEIDDLEVNKTWTIEDLPPGKHAIGCVWVFRLKFRADGTLERYKACLVVLGNKQIAGEDYCNARLLKKK